ncbi:MAG: hypothetical protein AAF291_08235 [Pseudomonadota bacterium]
MEFYVKHLLVKYGRITPLTDAEREALSGMATEKTAYKRARQSDRRLPPNAAHRCDLLHLWALENAILSDRLVSLGRTRGLVRAASVIMEVVCRRSLALQKPLARIELNMTQEQIGLAIGLTGIQVNRLMRERHVERRGLALRIRQSPDHRRCGARRYRRSCRPAHTFPPARAAGATSRRTARCGYRD